MPFEQKILPQFRDADPDGLVGLRGAMHYFQHIHTWFMHSIGKGNDVLPEQYQAAWIYTRVLVSLSHKLDYTDAAEIRAWMEPYRQSLLVNIDMMIRQHGEIAAQGRIETGVFSLPRQRIVRLPAVDFPDGVPEAIPCEIPGFVRLARRAEGMREAYRRRVRYSDIDKSGHMNNLRYIELFQDAFRAAFWRAFDPSIMEITFFSQCREGEELTVYSREETGEVYLTAVHADGTPAAAAVFAKEAWKA